MRQFLEETIKEAGTLALKWFERRDEIKISQKGDLVKDLVTEADVDVEKFIKNALAKKYPDVGFFGEESGIQEGKQGRWIVDPIDGTLSFSRGHLNWGVSIGVEIDGEIQMGAVYGPAKGVFYIAEKGKGATCNGKPIQVSSCNALPSSVALTGFACLRANLTENNIPRFGRVASEVGAIRVLGSAALDLCMVAEGSAETFFEQNLNLYDVAAGALIVEEAGGRVTDFSGKPTLDPEQIIASNGTLHDTFVAMV